MGNDQGKYTLHYFDLRGRAEISRLIMAAASIPYTDDRMPRETWATIKHTVPLEALPYLEVNGIKVPQSTSIARYLARVGGLAGKTAVEQLQTDAVVDTGVDLLNAIFNKVFKLPEAQRPEAIKKFAVEELPEHLMNLDYIISLYGKDGYSVGSSLTWADLYIYEVLYNFCKANPNLLDSYPHIKSVRHSVESNPKVAEYLRTRPERPF